MTLWYYLTDRHERVAVAEDQLPGLAKVGLLRPNSLVWHEGMEGWQACGKVLPHVFGDTARAVEGAMPGVPYYAEEVMVGQSARSLSRWRFPLRVLGGLLLLAGLQFLILVGAVGQKLLFAAEGDSEAAEALKSVPSVPGIDAEKVVWFLSGLVSVFAIGCLWAGWELLKGARLAKQAAEGGGLQALTKAHGRLGRAALAMVIGLEILGFGCCGLMLFKVWKDKRPTEARTEVAI